LLLAGQLSEVVVPPAAVEAARELTRRHDAIRRDLMTARHRVSKHRLMHGRVYPQPSTWTVAHRRWLAGQQFEHRPASSRALICWPPVDGLRARARWPSESPARPMTHRGGPLSRGCGAVAGSTP
jgi:hypothetical protein